MLSIKLLKGSTLRLDHVHKDQPPEDLDPPIFKIIFASRGKPGVKAFASYNQVSSLDTVTLETMPEEIKKVGTSVEEWRHDGTDLQYCSEAST